ncbi:TetR family transcriptional regulator, partial [Streptomyces fagopyri]|uniref:TetR family transcriptional regulator n=1 Tax=Streptomyces fagopyri TaxID=2662397 RepID=UPI0033E0D3D0
MPTSTRREPRTGRPDAGIRTATTKPAGPAHRTAAHRAEDRARWAKTVAAPPGGPGGAAGRGGAPAAPLDEIARRAGVNIATLYRRFPDRD